MKKYIDFVKEDASLRDGNRGIENANLRDIEKTGKDKAREVNLGRLGELEAKSRKYSLSKKSELEALAVSAIKDFYGHVLDDVELEARMLSNGNDISEFMEKENEEKREDYEKWKENKPDDDEEDDDFDNGLDEYEEYEAADDDDGDFDDSDDDALPSDLAVDKKVIVNAIIQGAALNSRSIFNEDFIRDEIKNMFGDEADDVIKTWNELTKIYKDGQWLLDTEQMASAANNNSSMLKGATVVRDNTESKETHQAPSEETQEEAIEALKNDDIANVSDEVIEATIGKTIKAVGIDFPMLLHELVKGVYTLISEIALPRDEFRMEDTLKKTSNYYDEAEGFKYGPQLQQKLHTFFMAAPDIDKYPNILEYAYAKLIDSDRWSDEECLRNLKGIFSETKEARVLVNKLVKEVVDMFDAYYNDEEEEEDVYQVPQKGGKETQAPTINYSQMSNRELRDECDYYLDMLSDSDYSANDKEMAKRELSKISQYLESKSYSSKYRKLNEKRK